VAHRVDTPGHVVNQEDPHQTTPHESRDLRQNGSDPRGGRCLRTDLTDGPSKNLTTCVKTDLTQEGVVASERI
jgi:hypothetical protein